MEQRSRKEQERGGKNDAQPRTTEQEEGTPSREKEKPNIDQAYQPVGTRKITLGTRLQEPDEAEGKRQKTTPQHKDEPRGIRARKLHNTR